MSINEMVELTVPFQLELLPLVTNCVEQSARAFGLSREEGMTVTLAVEEVYSFLLSQTSSSQRMTLICRYGGYYMEVVCRFTDQRLPVKALNITATVDAEDDQSLGDMGLLLTARTMDRLYFLTNEKSTELHIIKEKKYPPLSEQPLENFSVKGAFLVGNGLELLKQFVKRTHQTYGSKAPSFFSFPGKVVDMVASGENEAVVLADQQGNVGGGMLWHRDGRMIEAYGPYLFIEDSQLARDIVEACLQKIARTKALCLILQDPTAQTPKEYFEELGQSGFFTTEGQIRTQQALYRQLEEDNGASCFAHAKIIPFLKERYRELLLPRQIHEVAYQGEGMSPHSAFSLKLDKGTRVALLSSLWVGQDAAQNLAEHVRILKQEGVLTIQFALDVGVPEQAVLGEALLTAGFAPSLVLPWAGKGDVLLFVYQGEG